MKTKVECFCPAGVAVQHPGPIRKQSSVSKSKVQMVIQICLTFYSIFGTTSWRQETYFVIYLQGK